MGALSTHAVNPSLYAKMPYDAVKDFAPITMVAVTPNVLVVNAALPVNSGEGVHRLREGEFRKARVRLGQQRQRRASRRRIVQGRDRHRDHPRSLQGRRAGDAGAARRRHAVHVRQSRERDAAGEGGQAQGARGHDGRALEARTRPADDGGGRATRVRHLDVVRPLRPGGNAEGRDRQVERRGRRRSSTRPTCANGSSRRAQSRRRCRRNSSPRSCRARFRNTRASSRRRARRSIEPRHARRSIRQPSNELEEA